MTASDARRLRELYGSPRYARLFASVRARLEQAAEGARSVTVTGLDPGEREAIASLFGWRELPGSEVRVELERLEAALRAGSAAATTGEVLVALGGPLRDLRGEREEALAARARMWTAARERLDGVGRPELLPWLDELAHGALARAARGGSPVEREALLDLALRVALLLPAGGKLLAVMAAEVAGDPHALDPGSPLNALALRAAALLAGWPEVPSTASARRQLWREVGVDCDTLSANVLVLGLRPLGEGRLARHLRESALAGEPRYVTLRELGGEPLRVAPGMPVHVCENPAVLAAAADALGGRSAPLVCVEGVPSTAAMELLAALARSGAALRVRADLDWAGLRIAAQVMAVAGGTPWRFRAADYAAALRAGKTGPALAGAPAAAPWDPALAAAMRDGGRSVPEERLLAELLEDLDPSLAPARSRCAAPHGAP